jgi:branched-chain amino acid transport system substrate-binding protein
VEFDAAFTKSTGAKPAYHAAEAYAALLVAADAMTRATALEPLAFVDALHKTKMDTAFGPIQFDAKGQNPHPVLVTQVQGGQYKVVWPPEAADTKPVAAPAWADRK